jgi:hypothetical protein
VGERLLRLRRSVVVLAFALLLLGAIGAACYLAIEVWRLEGALQHVVIAAFVLPVTALVLWQLAKWPALDGLGGSPDDMKERVAAAAKMAEQRRVEIAQRVAELRADPRRAAFAALAERGHVLDDAEIERRLARKAAIEAVPHRRPFAARVFDGSVPSDEQIDYLADASALATCGHLQPVERALRADGVPLRLVRVGVVAGDRRLRDDVVARFALPAGVVLQDELVDQRDDLHEQRLVCAGCRSELHSSPYGAVWPA